MAYEDPIKRAEREIEELEKLQREEMGLEAEPNAPEPNAEGKADPAKQPAEGQQPDGQQPEKQPEEQPDGQQPATQQEKQSVAPDQSPAEDPNSETYKARWEALSGIHRKMQGQIESLQNQVSVLFTENQQLKQQGAQQQQQQQTQPGGEGQSKAATVEEAIAELENEYGPAFIQALDRIVTARVKQTVDPINQEVQTVRQQQVKSAEETFLDALSAAVQGSDWRMLDRDPEFISWVQSNRIGAFSYQDALRAAYQRGDVAGTAQIFNDFIRQKQPAGQPARPNGSVQQPNNPNPAEMIVPNRRGGSGDHTRADNAQGKVWTAAEINEFYRKVELNKIEPKEAAKIEADIIKANMEGRIIG